LHVYAKINRYLSGGIFVAEPICIFLRGVNVSGVKMKMDELKRAFADMSFTDAKTILATGNVVISTSRGDNSALKSEIEKGLCDAFRYDAHIYLRTSQDLHTILSAAADLSVPPGCHLYYLICDDMPVIAELNSVFSSLPHKQNEAFVPNAFGAFWIVPAGETLDSAFGSKALGSKKYKDKLTSRNMNTIEKIAKVMSE
jgi:uncharacterized protein (DUF1697 family)